jgi:hypothetical protein
MVILSKEQVSKIVARIRLLNSTIDSESSEDCYQELCDLESALEQSLKALQRSRMQIVH